MPIVSKIQLKSYFETGDRPTQGQFIDLIDSLALLGSNTSDITFIGTVTATTGSFSHLELTGNASFDSIDVGGGYFGAFAGSGLTITNTGRVSTDDYIFTETFLSASSHVSTPVIKSPINGYLEIQNGLSVTGAITSSTNISASGTGSFSYITASGNIFADSGSFNYLDVKGDIVAGGNVTGLTGSFDVLTGDGSQLTGIRTIETHGNQVSVTGSQTVPAAVNNTIVTQNTGEFTVPLGSTYTVSSGSHVDFQYTPIAERLYRYDVDTGDFIPFAQANIDSETTLIKGFGAGTAGVGNDVTVRHNATVPENFVTILYTTTNTTQSEGSNHLYTNPITTDPNSITIQDQSTYTIKQGADVTVDGVHHGVVRKDIALFSTLGIGDTQAIGPTGSEHFNDQLSRIYPSASAHLHISASDPRVVIEASTGAPEIALMSSASSGVAGFLSFKEGATTRSDDKWVSEFRFSYNANEATKPFRLNQINKTGSPTRIFQVFSGSSANALTITGSRVGIGTLDPQATLHAEGNITASGNLKIEGSQVDFTNLPTSDPGVAGRLYNDSGTIKISL